METESTALPRFRTDLVAQPIDDDGQRFVDVTDPDSGATFRFYDVEYSIACAMDGKRNLVGLVDWALEELGLEASPTELETIISTLDELGYLEAVTAAIEAAEAEQAARVPEVAPATDVGEGLVEDFELGAAGGSPEEIAAEEAAAALESDDLELGAPGKSPIAPPRPEMPKAPEVELGASGLTDDEVAAAPVEVRAITAELPKDEEGPDEMSFAGILDEEEAQTAVRAGPGEAAADAPQAGDAASDDAPTTVRGDAAARPAVSMGDFDDEEGLTPPPAEEPVPRLTPRGESDADYDGPTNLPPPQVHEYDDDDVSVDLSQHLSIDAEDVKEAVRASKVMDAVQVPDELLAEMDAAESGAKDAGAQKAKAEEKKPEEKPEEKKAEEKKPEEKPEGKKAKPEEPKPVELPDKPVKVASKTKGKKAATAEEEPATAAREQAEEERGNGLRVALLFILLLSCAAAYYFMVYKEKDQSSAPKHRTPTSRATQTDKPTTGPKVPNAPVVVAAKLAASEPSVETVIMPQDSALSWLVDDGSEVAAGERVAKLREFDRWERRLREYKAREEHYQRKADAATEKLEQAKAAGNQLNVKRFEGDVAKHQAKVVEKQELFKKAVVSLQQAELKAPVGGKVEHVARVGAFVKTGAPVVKISAEAALHATFTLPKGKTADGYTVDEEVELSGKTDPGATQTCTVIASVEDKVTVSCAEDEAFADGDEVVLE